MNLIFKENELTTSIFIKLRPVDSEYRKKGIGNLIMKYLLNYIETKGSNNAYIGLMSTPNKESFYGKFGFEKRPNQAHKHGMIKFLEKRSSQ